MKNVIRKMFVGMTAIIMMLPVVANAQDVVPACTVSEASAAIVKTKIAIIEPGDTFQKHVRTRLEAKAMSAKSKLSESKWSEANDKLDAIIEKISDMLGAPKAKIHKDNVTTAEDIQDYAADAMACILSIQESY